MIRAQFRIRLPDHVWAAEVTPAFPKSRFSLLSGYMVEDRAVELREIHTTHPEEVVAAMRDQPSIHEFELLESVSDRALCKYETTDTGLYEFITALSLPIEFPVTVRNGWFEFDLTGTREELDRLQTTLDDSPLTYDLLSLVGTSETESLLTDRQREVLDAAVRLGYFEVPHECTLAELAAEVGIDKASTSTLLRRGQARIVKWFLTGPEIQ